MKASKISQEAGATERLAQRSKANANTKPEGRSQWPKEQRQLQAQVISRTGELAAWRTEYPDNRFNPVAPQPDSLMNLFVAAARLHMNLDQPGVLLAIREILSDLIGARALALFEIDATGANLSLVEAIGVQSGCMADIPLGAGVIGGVAKSGAAYFTDHGGGELVACVPLTIGAGVTGVFVLYQLLEQKPQLEPRDRELLDFLSTHAALALYRSAAYGAARNSGGACQ